MIWQVAVVCVLFPILGQGLERGEECTNSMGKKSTCTTIYSCKAAIDAMKEANGAALYASGTMCGFDTESLVCCRTVSDVEQTIDTTTDTTESDTIDLKIFTNASAFDVVDHVFVLSSPTTVTSTDIVDTNVQVRLGSEINPLSALDQQQDVSTDDSQTTVHQETEEDCNCEPNSDESTVISTNAPFLSGSATESTEKHVVSDVNSLQSNVHNFVISNAAEEPTTITVCEETSPSETPYDPTTSGHSEGSHGHLGGADITISLHSAGSDGHQEEAAVTEVPHEASTEETIKFTDIRNSGHFEGSDGHHGGSAITEVPHEASTDESIKFTEITNSGHAVGSGGHQGADCITEVSQEASTEESIKFTEITNLGHSAGGDGHQGGAAVTEVPFETSTEEAMEHTYITINSGHFEGSYGHHGEAAVTEVHHEASTEEAIKYTEIANSGHSEGSDGHHGGASGTEVHHEASTEEAIKFTDTTNSGHVEGSDGHHGGASGTEVHHEASTEDAIKFTYITNSGHFEGSDGHHGGVAITEVHHEASTENEITNSGHFVGSDGHYGGVAVTEVHHEASTEEAIKYPDTTNSGHFEGSYGHHGGVAVTEVHHEASTEEAIKLTDTTNSGHFEGSYGHHGGVAGTELHHEASTEEAIKYPDTTNSGHFEGSYGHHGGVAVTEVHHEASTEEAIKLTDTSNSGHFEGSYGHHGGVAVTEVHHEASTEEAIKLTGATNSGHFEGSDGHHGVVVVTEVHHEASTEEAIKYTEIANSGHSAGGDGHQGGAAVTEVPHEASTEESIKFTEHSAGSHGHQGGSSASEVPHEVSTASVDHHSVHHEASTTEESIKVTHSFEDFYHHMHSNVFHVPPVTEIPIEHVLPGKDVCGYQLKRNRMSNAVISSIDEFPWMALLGYEDEHGKDVGFKCVATLITERHLVTSSECVATGPGTYKLKSVRLGEWSISNPTDCVFDHKKMVCPDKIVNVGVEKTFSHPHGNHKLALLQLERTVNFTDYIRPICLHAEKLPAPSEKTTLTSSGWGSSKSGCLLDIKSKIQLPVVPNSKCYACEEDQICVNALTKNKICKTDDGGPVMSLDKSNKAHWFLEGVIPEGFSCNNQGTVGVYTRVSHHISWIISVLKDHLRGSSGSQVPHELPTSGHSAGSDGGFEGSSASEVPHEANVHRDVLPLSHKNSVHHEASTTEKSIKVTHSDDDLYHNMDTHEFYVHPVPPVNEVPNENVLPHVCGYQLKRNRMSNSFISTIDEFPWTALLRYEDQHGKDVGFKCVGTLITERHLVTSSECVATGPGTYKLKSVRLGEWSISNPTDCVRDYKKMLCPNKVVDVGIEKTFSHPHGIHNLALLRMERRVDFTDYVRPICLPVGNLPAPPENTTLTSAGWGSSKSGCLLDIKSKINLPVVPKSYCHDCEEDQICVNALTKNKVCKTDNGGPVMSLDKNHQDQWFLEGVIPEGFSCDHQGTVGVYTRVSHHISWIISMLKGDGV